MSDSERTGTKLKDDSFDVIRNQVKAWKKGLTFENLRFPERYVSGDAHLFIRFVLPLDFTDYVSCFQFAAEGEIIPSPLLIKCCTPRMALSCNREHETMLVNSIKLMESPKKVIVSSVWTDTVDEVFGLWGHSMCFSGRYGFISCATLKNREVDHGISDANATGKLTSQMIQCGSQIVSGVTEQQPNIGRNRRNIAQDELRAIRFNVELGRTKVNVLLDKSSPYLAQLRDVVFGPFDLQEWAAQI